MKSNILLVSLDYDFTKAVAIKLANYFDMHYLDIQGLIEYSLMDKENMKLKCGLEYVEREEQKIATSARNYENAVINFPYDLFMKNGNSINLNDTSITIFIKINDNLLYNLNSKKDGEKKLVVELITQNELSEILEKKTEAVVEIKSIDENECVHEIVEKLREILSKMGDLLWI